MKKIARAIRTGFAEPRRRWPKRTSRARRAPRRRRGALSKLAHELKTPLSAIVVAAEIMKDQRFGAIANERYRSYTADIHDNARHALAVIDRILVDGRPEPAAGRPHATDLDLNALAESAVSAVRPLAEEAGLTSRPSCTHSFRTSSPTP